MLYTYFTPVISDEHMLYANEIAVKYNIVTKTGKEATSFVSAYLKYLAAIFKEKELYYVTSHGPARVYRKAFYEKAMERLIAKSGYNKIHKATINDKNYYIEVKQ